MEIKETENITRILTFEVLWVSSGNSTAEVAAGKLEKEANSADRNFTYHASCTPESSVC